MPHSLSTSVQLKVPYYDVDIMQIVWNGNYFKYFEVARQAFFKECGLDLLDYAKTKGYLFPVIRSTIKHVRPLRMDDEFVCTAILKEAKIKIVLDLEIKRLPDGLVCAKGRSEQVAYFLPEKEMAFSIPEDIRNALYGKK
jgi:acyl-CoA thioester hydrolase